MKKLTKTLTASVLAVAASTSVLAVPASHVSYAADPSNADIVKGDIFQVEDIPSTWTKGVELTLPETSGVAVTVTRPDGRQETLNGHTFIPSMAGTYKVQYSKGITLSEVFYIKVTSEVYEMVIDSNDDVILPAIVDAEKTRYDDEVIKSVVLPNPTIYDKNGYVLYENGAVNPKFAEYEELAAKETAGTITSDEATRLNELEEEFREYNVGEEDRPLYKNATLEIEVVTESKTYSNAVGATNALTFDATSKHYSFVPEEGTNVIRYVYKTASGVNLQSLTKTIVGSKTYNHTTIKLGWKAPDRPTTASLNDKVYLPLATAYDKSDANASINVKTIINVSLKETSGLTPVTVSRDEKGYYFIPTVKDGSYVVSYNVEDFYGNKGVEESYTIEKVVDSKAPTMYIVNEFDVDDYKTADTTDAEDALDNEAMVEAILKMQNAEYMIPTTVSRTDGYLVFPAMFGQDSVVDYKNLSYYRTITSTALDVSVDLQDTSYLVPQAGESSDDVKNITKQYIKASHNARINLNKLKTDESSPTDYYFPAGDYTVTYTVRDGNGYSASRSFTFTLKDSYEDTVAPVVTYADNFPTLVQDGQEVKFLKPTIVDAQDSRLKINYYVTIGAYDVEIFEKDGYISFNMSDYAATVVSTDKTIYELALDNAKKITVKTVVKDFYNNETIKSVDIAVRNANDTVAPTLVANEDPAASVNTYRQGSVVTVAGVTITDDDPNLNIIVTVRDAAGNKVYGTQAVGAITKTPSGDNTVYNHPGITFTATKAESYTVTYTAIDAGNNIVAYTVKLPTLTDTEKPTITGVTSGKVFEIELGQKLDLGRVSVFDNGVETAIKASISCEAHPEYINGTIFAPTEAGTYTVKYTADDGYGNDAEPVYVEVKVADTTAPTLTINNKDAYGTTIKSDSSITNSSDFSRVELPSFSAEDDFYDFGIAAGALNMYAKAEITIAGPDGKTYTVDSDKDKKYGIFYDAVKDVYSFLPTVKGKYVVTYSAVDASGNKAKDYAIEVLVGDTVLPTVSYEGELSANLKVGDVIKIDEKEINITDNIMNAGYTFTFSSITMEDASGNAVEYETMGEDDEIRAYTFSKAGTYTLTVSAKDEAGNSNYFQYKINVTTTSSGTNIKDNVTGVVLIVVSLLILGGVIIYFAKDKRKISPKKAAKKVETTVKEENKD